MLKTMGKLFKSKPTPPKVETTERGQKDDIDDLVENIVECNLKIRSYTRHRALDEDEFVELHKVPVDNIKEFTRATPEEFQTCLDSISQLTSPHDSSDLLTAFYDVELTSGQTATLYGPAWRGMAVVTNDSWVSGKVWVVLFPPTINIDLLRRSAVPRVSPMPYENSTLKDYVTRWRKAGRVNVET